MLQYAQAFYMESFVSKGSETAFLTISYIVWNRITCRLQWNLLKYKKRNFPSPNEFYCVSRVCIKTLQYVQAGGSPLSIRKSLACTRASKLTTLTCISPESGANVNRQWSQVGWMLTQHRDGLLSSSFLAWSSIAQSVCEWAFDLLANRRLETSRFESCIQQRYIARARCESQLTVGSSGLNARWS